MRFLSTTIFTVLLVLSLVLLANPATAAQQVEITVKVIHASTNGHKISDNVKDIYLRLKHMFNFTSYNKILEHQDRKEYNKHQELSLPNGQKLLLTPLEKDDKSRIKVELEIPNVIKTDFRLKDGGTIILGGTKYKDGVLILVIQVAER